MSFNMYLEIHLAFRSHACIFAALQLSLMCTRTLFHRKLRKVLKKAQIDDITDDVGVLKKFMKFMI